MWISIILLCDLICKIFIIVIFFSESAMLELVLVRHGETDSNKTHTIQVSELLGLFFF